VRFYLGVHMPHWLETVDVPLFVSHMRLKDRSTLPRARGRWALDSGSFSQVALTGGFTTTPAEYVAAVRRYRDEIGQLDWAAPQDHMCEPWVLAKSRLAQTVEGAQRWTVENYLRLRDTDPALPFVPVLQGQTIGDYRRHADAYTAAGVDLVVEPVVGVGSVCRRQATGEIAALLAALHGDGIALHGFGVKADGLRRYGWCLRSADSMAWSFRGRRIRPCPHRGVTSCANCLPHALAWRASVLSASNELARPIQGVLL
jgi:hypothetical protein